MNMDLKTSNPAFAGNTYTVNGVAAGYGPTMTISGTVNKAGILMVCVLATAAWTWNQFFTNGPAAVGGYTMSGLSADSSRHGHYLQERVVADHGANLRLLEGLFLGALSAMLEMRFPGIAIESVALTFGTCFCMLLAYRSGLIRPTQKFVMGVVAATGGIAVVYFASMILGLFHVQIPGIFGSGPMGILFSLAVVIVAAFESDPRFLCDRRRRLSRRA